MGLFFNYREGRYVANSLEGVIVRSERLVSRTAVSYPVEPLRMKRPFTL